MDINKIYTLIQDDFGAYGPSGLPKLEFANKMKSIIND